LIQPLGKENLLGPEARVGRTPPLT